MRNWCLCQVSMPAFRNVLLLLFTATIEIAHGSEDGTSGSGFVGDIYDGTDEVEEDDSMLCVKPTEPDVCDNLHTNYTDALGEALCISTCVEEVRLHHVYSTCTAAISSLI